MQALLRAIPFKVKLFVGTLGTIAIVINVAMEQRPLFAGASREPEVIPVVPRTFSYTNRITLTTNFCSVVSLPNEHNINFALLNEYVPWDVLVNGTTFYECAPAQEHKILRISEQVHFIQFRLKPKFGPAEETLEYRITPKR